MSDASKRKAKPKWAIEKPKLVNARKLRGIFFIEPELLASMPCNTPINSGGKPTAVLGKVRQNMVVLSVQADESTRIRLEGAPCRYHEDHVVQQQE